MPLFSRMCLLAFILSAFSVIYGQEVLPVRWQQFEDAGNGGSAEAWAISMDKDGHLYWFASSNQSGEGLDVVGHKFSSDGHALWPSPFNYGGPGTQHAYVSQNYGQHVYVGGRVCEGLVQTCDMLLLKISASDGQLIWDRSLDFDASGYDEVDGLAINETGIYCGGWAQVLNGGIYQSDIGFWHLDGEGQTLYTNFHGANHTAEHQDGHMVVDDDFIYAAGLWGGRGLANLYNGYSFLGKFDRSTGALVDSVLFGPQSDNFLDIENALGMTSDGDYLYVTGYSTPESAQDWQIFTAKFDKNLQLIWLNQFGGTGNESARGIAVREGMICVAGLTESPEWTTGGKRDALLLLYDEDGQLLKFYTHDVGGLDEAFQDLVLHESGIYLTGTVETNGTFSGKKGMLVAADQILNADDNAFQIKARPEVFPNPAQNRVRFRFEEEPFYNTDITIYSTTGEKLPISLRRIGRGEYEWDTPDRGMYYVEFKAGNHRYVQAILIKN